MPGGIGYAARAAVGVAATCGALLATAGPAAASDGVSQGSCSAGAYVANYSVSYGQTTDGSNDRIYTIQWDIKGPAGPRNNVTARVKEDNDLGHDKIYYTWPSGDDVPVGHQQIDLRTEDIRVPTRMRMYVEFTFTFDVPEKKDVRCVGHTRNV
jgi:hypothetical protein